jgi:hypothetical protein
MCTHTSRRNVLASPTFIYLEDRVSLFLRNVYKYSLQQMICLQILTSQHQCYVLPTGSLVYPEEGGSIASRNICKYLSALLASIYSLPSLCHLLLLSL